MPPKIRGMTQNAQPLPGASRRFTLMISGDDAQDDNLSEDRPLKGLPHERFLLGESAPIAPVLLLGQSSQTVDPQQVIACLQPVHFHATRDHLVLLGQNQVDLTHSESDQLLKAALPFIEEDFQNPILFHDQHYWFIPAGPFSSLASYSVDQAQGRNIDWWMPRDTHEDGIAKRWRKLQNEIQMLWHIGPVNEEREQQGLPSINSVWISGIGKLSDAHVPDLIKQSRHLYGQHPILAGIARLIDLPHSQEIAVDNFAGAFALLTQPESIWSDIQSALNNKQIDELILIDFPNGKTRERIFTAKDLHQKSWAFWKKSAPLSWKDITAS
jgi:hypothetical protein